MNWIPFLIFVVVLWFVVSRILPVKGLRNLTETEIASLMKKTRDNEFIDVREVHEYGGGHIRGFKNIPLSQLSSRIAEIDPSHTIVLTCQSGMRSRQAARVLRKHGFQNICQLPTGVSGWSGKLVK
ncbi:rhodanese-like domain-containing protein [Tumebacillus sp. ITR2]|uniref:Rhodanese-like domain-containing protein n=1 Tax=Tumebacillus amylolyticus TaxID=2801339 RepID=A0ABS1J5P4_9BACL|nr:rhodanese-like domain-containing protein [Tumebacillus amylolyticus]MBL0385607.1 rhodanese-like domain-containing protein [Tumebacillus amylolyticus]